MRYLVINNQVYDTEKEGVIDYNTRQYIVGINKFNFNEIQREANTIEGLCDFCIEKIEDSIFVYSINEFEKNKKMLKDLVISEYPQVKMYFAIETDKGLIYVAKMNKKEEFELL